jgi:hypothetical protein
MEEDEKGKLIRKLDMRVAAKVLQQLASGIYRSPAGSIKELVSNAFDADAPRVDITIDIDETNRRLKKVTVEDSGSGMDLSEFEWFAEHIGASLKRTTGETTPNRRPIIGKIGIGLLSVGHATNRFSISSAKEKQKFTLKAHVDLSPYYSARLQVQTLDELRVGNLTIYQEEGEVPDHAFTKVEFGELKDPFARDVASPALDEKHKFDWNGATYQDFVDWLDTSEIVRIERLSGFSKFMFDLGLLAPVRYLPGGPIRGYDDDHVLRRINNRLSDFDFHVFVNKTEVFKPILFPHDLDGLTRKGDDYKLYPVDIDCELSDGRVLKAIGYYYHQVKRIIPLGLRGMLIRVNNVGIGSYENSFAKIYTQSPVVLHQLTGELYVDQGLDSALNIDRSSFFESDEAYQKLWLEVGDLLNPKPEPAEPTERAEKPEVEEEEIKPVKETKARVQKATIGRDIKKRLTKRERRAREKKAQLLEEDLVIKISELLKSAKLPQTKSSLVNITIDPESTSHVTLSVSGTSTKIKVVLRKNIREPIRSTFILLLIVLELAFKKRNVSEIREAVDSLLNAVM